MGNLYKIFKKDSRLLTTYSFTNSKKTKERHEAEEFGTSKIAKIRKYFWNLTEYPETSKAAKVFK